jgi:hypothetical protein
MPNNYVLLETIALTQAAASVTFDNLPTSGYTDLKIVMSARTSAAATYTNILISLNGNTTSFSSRELYGAGSGTPGSGSGSGAGAGQGILYMNADSSTANTFGNGEIYIPNYRSTNAKSYSGDSVTENNATLALATLKAGLWNPGTQAAITTITLTPDSSSFLANSTFSLYGIAALGTTPVTAPKATGGNIVANDGTYWYHAFTSSGNFVPQVGLTADCLVIAGGGGGYDNLGGGGGAGGYRSATGLSLTTTSYGVTVGAGGAVKTKGADSVFSSITSTGGGGTPYGAGGSGGSGGGGTRDSAAGGAGNTPSTSPSQGNNGGAAGGSSGFGGGGGGGASAAGSAGTSTVGGTGGAGSNAHSTWASATNTGVSGYYAGGGGGASYPNTGPARAGGAGGGGNGGYNDGGGTYLAPTAGTANTGGGGGGAPNGPNAPYTSNQGGSGIVIIRYPIA